RSVRAMARKYVRVARRSGPFVAHERVAPGRVARTAAGLVVIHALVGRSQQLFERGAVLGEPRGAGADRERYAHAGPRLERVGADRRLQILHAPGLAFRRAVPQHDDELVAREARAQIVLADRRTQHVADRPEGAIARLVAVGVVDFLEPIEVEDDD